VKGVNVDRIASPLDIVSIDLCAEACQLYSGYRGAVAGRFPLRVKQHHFAAALYWHGFAYAEKAMKRVGSIDMKLDRTPKLLIARLRYWRGQRHGEGAYADLGDRRDTKQNADNRHYKTHVRLYRIGSEDPSVAYMLSTRTVHPRHPGSENRAAWAVGSLATQIARCNLQRQSD
jgi:hypothetical protein